MSGLVGAILFGPASACSSLGSRAAREQLEPTRYINEQIMLLGLLVNCNEPSRASYESSELTSYEHFVQPYPLPLDFLRVTSYENIYFLCLEIFIISLSQYFSLCYCPLT